MEFQLGLSASMMSVCASTVHLKYVSASVCVCTRDCMLNVAAVNN